MTVGRAGQISFVFLAVITVISPYIWIVLSSLKGPADLSDPKKLWFVPILDNWENVLSGGIMHYFLNSLIVGVGTVALSLLTGTPAAYSISQYKTGGRLARFSILISEVLPPAVMAVPLFLISYYLKMNGTLVPVIIAHLTFVLPVVTWFMISFFDAVPKDIESQAMIDGCSRFMAFRKVVLPQVLPGVGAAGLFGFVLSWNDLFYALILGGQKTKTLPMAIAGYDTFRGVLLGEMSVAILVSVIPTLFLSFFVQKTMIQGIGGGGVKG
jgi:ABC-type glycerol-3-phosphate transport system permease component